MVFVVVRWMDNVEEIFGVMCVIFDFDNVDVEFVVLVCLDFKGLGLGCCLMEKLIVYICDYGLKWLNGIMMLNNCGMVVVVRKLGF